MHVSTLRTSLRLAVLGQVLTLLAASGPVSAEAPSGTNAKGGIRVGCGVLSDSKGRTVTPNATVGDNTDRPAYCPKSASTPAAVEAHSDPLTDPAPDVAPSVDSTPLPPSRTLRALPAGPAKPALKRLPEKASTAQTERSEAIESTATTEPEAAKMSAPPVEQPLESSRTTHAYGGFPVLRLDPVGAGLALVSGGGLVWFLRSAFAASLLLMGLPVWRDLDLLPVMDTGTFRADSGALADVEDEEDAGRALLTLSRSGQPLPMRKS